MKFYEGKRRIFIGIEDRRKGVFEFFFILLWYRVGRGGLYGRWRERLMIFFFEKYFK